jgi:hypothetical protein
MVRGDYVRCLFPFRESTGPGLSPHIVLVTGTGRIGGTPAVIVFYTTSQVTYEGARRPRHLIHVDEFKATALGQAKAFDIDVTRVALLPVTTSYFPELRDGMVRTYGWDTHLAGVVERRLAELKASGHRIDLVRAEGPAPGMR